MNRDITLCHPAWTVVSSYAIVCPPKCVGHPTSFVSIASAATIGIVKTYCGRDFAEDVRTMEPLPDVIYEKRLQAIIHGKPYGKKGDRPTRLLDHLYIGNYKDAADLARLKDVGITHVVNCAACRPSEMNPYGGETGVVGYQQFYTRDHQTYNILQHFAEARDVIDEAKRMGGKALVHCAMGINRCAAICIAYIMADQNMDLYQAVDLVKQQRGIALFNIGFQRQLIGFARENGYLPCDSRSGAQQEK